VLVRGVAVRGADGRAVRVAGSLTDITEGKVADALTGLPNRVLFVDRLGRLLELTRRRQDLQFAVLFLDLDRFKNVNDSLGHLAGDELLIQVARRLETSLRATDTITRMGTAGGSVQAGHTVARLGGDEFAIILTALHDAGDAVYVAGRIAEAFSEPFRVAGQDVFTSASVGIATSRLDYQSPEELLRDADTAMYHAKAAGRARCEVFDESMRAQAVRRLQVENDLRHALERHEFVLHYQPIVSLTDTRTMGLEALVRWNHPERGLLAPGEFIGVAEETGLIVPMGYWVLEEVCRHLRAWMDHDPPLPPFTVSVNLSARQLAQPDLVPRVLAITKGHRVLPGWIEFEITESSVMAKPDEAEQILKQLKAAGFRLAIDDFGTGYSSLNYVHRFPVDRLKIDRSFLGREGAEHTGENGDRIVAAIIQLAEHLKLDVVAEGVESKEHLDQLKMLHCGFGQGFYFARPVGLPTAEDFLPRTLAPDAKKAG
jgi:predicted signal transduction protein with EAL and GGDEF domain